MRISNVVLNAVAVLLFASISFAESISSVAESRPVSAGEILNFNLTEYDSYMKEQGYQLEKVALNEKVLNTCASNLLLVKLENSDTQIYSCVMYKFKNNTEMGFNNKSGEFYLALDRLAYVARIMCDTYVYPSIEKLEDGDEIRLNFFTSDCASKLEKMISEESPDRKGKMQKSIFKNEFNLYLKNK